MHKVLLTIDLDYWTYDNKSKLSDLYLASVFINKIKSHCSYNVIEYHHEILDHCNDEYDKIINIDYHNDIVEDAENDLNEGTWGNFLPKQYKEFEWRYPDYYQCIKLGDGICVPTPKNKKLYPLKYVQKQSIKDLPLDNIKKCVFCLSRQWDYDDKLNYILEKTKLC